MMAQINDKRDLNTIVNEHFPALDSFVEVYKDIHQNPELGEYESRTAGIAAKHLKDLGFKVTEHIGGYGAVGVLLNGSGNTYLLRADMDALPIRENTELPYSSTKYFTDRDGKEKPVMHACGHDMNVTNLMATATLLCKAKFSWSGTLICLFQPNEENGAGAMAMIKDGLYDVIPRADYVLAQHCDHGRSGSVAIHSGPCESAADSFLVRIYGHGGHGAMPESCIDPILIASYVIVRLQSVVSRVVAPQDSVVITCGSFHGGDAHNIIPESVDIKLNIRTYNEKVREKVLDSVRGIIEAECESAGAPRKPEIKQTHQYPLTDNDPEIAQELRSLFEDSFGASQVHEMLKLAGSEDFPNLALPNKSPYAIWFIGSTPVEKYDDALKNGQLDRLPQIHSNNFAPSILPTMKTGVRAFSLAALNYLT